MINLSTEGVARFTLSSPSATCHTLSESRFSTGRLSCEIPYDLRYQAADMSPGSNITMAYRHQHGFMPSDLINDGIVADIRANTPI